MMPAAIEPATPSVSRIWAGVCPIAAASAGGSAHGAENGGRVKTGGMHAFAGDHAEPVRDLDADHQAFRHIGLRKTEGFARREEGRDDHHS